MTEPTSTGAVYDASAFGVPIVFAQEVQTAPLPDPAPVFAQVIQTATLLDPAPLVVGQVIQTAPLLDPAPLVVGQVIPTDPSVVDQVLQTDTSVVGQVSVQATEEQEAIKRNREDIRRENIFQPLDEEYEDDDRRKRKKKNPNEEDRYSTIWHVVLHDVSIMEGRSWRMFLSDNHMKIKGVAFYFDPMNNENGAFCSFKTPRYIHP